MRFLRLTLLILLILVVVVLTWVNTASVELNYLIGSVELPLPIALWSSAFIGAILGFLASLGMIVRMKRDNARLKRAARLAETEVNNLRNLPIRNDR
ncbi:LapA family protein [Gammaproteobacteria bacterium AB-CW1]|uniref:LapA family protein n=1 Tax=Natronospira elongata TaxID=3110268 RepID=A0AAP6MKI1_9GAMM|nr:LapA family protein [Gammaproteobacteria bacterium AB-CW1]